jgi:hypothetical protein
LILRYLNFPVFVLFKEAFLLFRWGVDFSVNPHNFWFPHSSDLSNLTPLWKECFRWKSKASSKLASFTSPINEGFETLGNFQKNLEEVAGFQLPPRPMKRSWDLKKNHLGVWKLSMDNIFRICTRTIRIYLDGDSAGMPLRWGQVGHSCGAYCFL